MPLLASPPHGSGDARTKGSGPSLKKDGVRGTSSEKRFVRGMRATSP